MTPEAWMDWLFSPARDVLVEDLMAYIYAGLRGPSGAPVLDPEGRIPTRRAVEAVADALKTDADWLCILQPRPTRDPERPWVPVVRDSGIFSDDVERALQMTQGFHHPNYICPIRLRPLVVSPWELLRMWDEALCRSPPTVPPTDLYYPTRFDPPLPHWMDSLPLIVGLPMPPALRRAVGATIAYAYCPD